MQRCPGVEPFGPVVLNKQELIHSQQHKFVLAAIGHVVVDKCGQTTSPAFAGAEVQSSVFVPSQQPVLARIEAFEWSIHRCFTAKRTHQQWNG